MLGPLQVLTNKLTREFFYMVNVDLQYTVSDLEAAEFCYLHFGKVCGLNSSE